MPLERPTRGVQGFLGVKWYEAIGGGVIGSCRALQRSIGENSMTEVKLEELIDSIQEWCGETELAELPPVARDCGSVDSYSSHPVSFMYEESYD